MYGYATSSAGAARLTQFSSPQQTANESGQTAQNSAVSHAASSAQATNPILDFIRTAIEDLIKDLQEVFSPQNGGETTIALGILDAIAATGTSTGSSGTIEGMVTGVIGAEASLGSLGAVAAAPAAEVAPALSGFTTAAAAGGAGLGNVTASLARAGTIGSMSVPVSWSAQSTSKIAGLETAGMTSLGGTEEAVGSGYPGFPGMPGATASRGMGVPIPPRYGVKLTVMPRPASVG
jgi:PPE-repeat protein